MNNGETVFIVDSDGDSCRRVCELVQSMKLRHQAFSLAQDFLDQYDPHHPGCAILEVRLPDVSGLLLQQQLAESQPVLPVIFHAAHASVPVVVRAIRQGAVNFLQKPAEEQELWESIQQALQVDRERRAAVAAVDRLRRQLACLSEKEIHVLALLAQYKSTREIAHDLAVSVRTVESRRASMLEKLELQTSIELFHFAIRALHGCTVGPDGRSPHECSSRGNGSGHVNHSRKGYPVDYGTMSNEPAQTH